MPLNPALALPPRRLQWLAQAVLTLGCVGLDPGWLLGTFTLVLVLMAALKLLEARDRGGRRLVALLQLVGCGLLAAQQPDLLPSLLQLLTAVLALAGLLQLESGQSLGWRRLLRLSLRVIAAALPVALVLFLLVPRVGPFGPGAGWPAGGAATGLSATLDPGSIASLVDNTAPAARVAFSANRPPAPGQRYWRVLVHPRFDGSRWLRDGDAEAPPRGPQPPWSPPRSASAGGVPPADQVWLVEPSRFTAVPWSGRASPLDPNLRPQPTGELRLLRPTVERRSYRLLEQGEPAAWQALPPRLLDLVLPQDRNPRLLALGRSWADLADPLARVQAAERWFRSNRFRYSRTPGNLPDANGLDVFLFERREGFCGHYASAFSALMRAAGIPSRVVSGYRGGNWVVPVSGASYLELRQSDAHAWSEVWLPGRGWLGVDPSAWLEGGAAPSQAAAATGRGWGSWRWVQRQWWGLDMAWSRWWLGFDQAQQEALLRGLLGERRELLGWLVLAGVGLTLGLALPLLRGRATARDRAGRDLAELLRLLRRLGLEAEPGETLERLARRAALRHPALEEPLNALVRCHAERRYGPATDPAATRRARQDWRSGLRRLIRRRREALRLAADRDRDRS